MFPYYVNHGMEFLRVQDQRNMIVSFWQKEDGEECFTQKSFVNNGVRIMVKGDGVKYQGDVVDKEKSDGSIESIIQWDGDHPDEQVHNADASFVRKTYRVYVNVDSIKTVCYDGKYDFNKKYVYTEWDEKGKLKSRGLVFGDLREVYPFKEFKDGIMTEYEYDYGVKSGAIDKETKKEIHHGAYVNSIDRPSCPILYKILVSVLKRPFLHKQNSKSCHYFMLVCDSKSENLSGHFFVSS